MEEKLPTPEPTTSAAKPAEPAGRERYGRRTVELVLSDQWFKYAMGNARNAEHALVYLATWSFASEVFPKARVTGDGTGYVEATYFKSNGEVGYVIGGVPDAQGKYGFHS